ncbi:MAG: DUF4296 domain-containing protein [Bacteroidota bacterium]
MKQLGITVLLFLIVVGCAEKVVEPPADVIPREKMITILYDLALLNATNSSFRNVMQKQNKQMMELLYERHNIDSLQLAQSDLYYASKPLEYEYIYEQIESRLKKKQKSLEDAKKQANDSIKNALKSGNKQMSQ